MIVKGDLLGLGIGPVLLDDWLGQGFAGALTVPE